MIACLRSSSSQSRMFYSFNFLANLRMFVQPVISSQRSTCYIVKSVLCLRQMWLKPKYTDVLFAVAASIVSAMTLGMYSLSLALPELPFDFFLLAF